MNCAPFHTTCRDDTTTTTCQKLIQSDEIQENSYHYIVIGGGTAGCPLAASLAKKGRTLLLERGKANAEDVELSDRAPCVGKDVKWTRTSAGSWAASANILGGGSAVNGGAFMKDTREGEFFNQHEFLDWEKVQNAYDQVTERLAHKREHPTNFQTYMVEAMAEVGLGENGVAVNTKHLGIYHPYSLFDKEWRKSTAASLLPQREDPISRNLTVKTNILVRRIICDTQAIPPRAIGIDFQELAQGPTKIQELIEPRAKFYISAGALNTPQLLMLSGIGDAQRLKRNKIEVVVDNPHVGMHLKDKPLISVSINSRVPIDNTFSDTMAMTKDFNIGTISGGRLTEQMAPVTLAMFPAKERSARNRKALEILLKLLPSPILKRINQQFSFYLILCHPISEGSVALASTDPYAQMDVFSPGFEDSRELQSMAKGLVVIRDLINSVALSAYRRDRGPAHQWSPRIMRKVGQLYSWWSQYGDRTLRGSTPVTFPMLPDLDSLSCSTTTTTPVLPTSKTQICEKNNNDDDDDDAFQVPSEIERWLKAMYTEGWTYTSTCRFGDVVNHDFTVKGVDGLFIVDASVLMRPPVVNGQATMMMLGLYAGELAPTPEPPVSTSLSSSFTADSSLKEAV